MAKKFHYNPDTGEVGVCPAQKKCRLIPADQHCDTKEEAQAAYEQEQLEELFKPFQKDKDFLPFDEDGLKRASRMMRDPELSADDREKLDRWLFSHNLKKNPAVLAVALLGMKHEREWAEERSSRTHTPLPHTAPPREPFANVSGIKGAREDLWESENEYKALGVGYQSYYGAENDFEQVIDRYVQGERAQLDQYENGRDLPHEDRLLAIISPGSMRNDQLYLATAWPDTELKPVLERLGVQDVRVGRFNNGREWGLTYTVADPSVNGTRTFSVYQHRNTDSIIINGRTNWDREGLPYAVDHKDGFFAELPYDGERQAAETLGFFLKSAQSGELGSDSEVVSKAEHLDWNATISEQVPEFGEWLDESDPGWRDRGKRF